MVAAVVAAVLVGGTAQSAPIPPTSHLVTDRQLGCDGGAYAAGARRSLETDDSGEVLTVRVRVLLNGIGLQRAQEVFRLVAEGYAQAGITIQPSFENVRFGGTDPKMLINDAKAYFGGEVPQGTDAVYVFSAVSELAGYKVGEADCLGGMQWRDHAFAAGPEWTVEQYGGWRTGTLHPLDPAALIAAHEIGHLLGGVHEYGDCADVANPRPCDLMWDKVLPLPFISFRFSTLNESIVRATARAVIAARQP